MLRSPVVVDAARRIIVRQDRPSPLYDGVRTRNGRHKAFGIRMDRVGKYLFGRSRLEHVTEVKHADPAADIFYHRQIVRYEKIGRVRFLLNVFHQINNLSLDRNVECADTLVRYDKARIHYQRACYADPLPLTAGKLVGIPVDVLRRKTNFCKHPLYLLFPLAPGAAQVMNIQPFANDLSDFFLGFRLAIGS